MDMSTADSQRDFDFHIGTWSTHVSRLLRPLSGSTEWAEYDGTTVVHPVWDGQANLVELDVQGPAGRIQALSLRLFDPDSGAWSLNTASIGGGGLSPPGIGHFRQGRGEFVSREPFGGREILVRFVIFDITPTSCRFEQAFSDDDGATWEVNWRATDLRREA